MDEFGSYVEFWKDKKLEEHERQLKDLYRRESAIARGEMSQERLNIIGKQIDFHHFKINELS